MAQVQSEEYTSKSEIVNDLTRKARAQQSEIEFIREKLIKSEQSGFRGFEVQRYENVR